MSESKKTKVGIDIETADRRELLELLDSDDELSTLERNIIRMRLGIGVDPDEPLEHADSYRDDEVRAKLLRTEIDIQSRGLGPRGIKKAKIIARLKQIIGDGD